MSEHDTRHSGSRWEPTPASVPEKDVPAGDVPVKDKPAVDGPGNDTARAQAPDDERIASPTSDTTPADPASFAPNGEAVTDRMALPAAHGSRSWPVLLPAVPLSGPSPSPPPRRNLRRAGLLAAAAAGLLALGGAGGYAIGSAASGSDHAGSAGLAGVPGGYGHHRGRFGADGGFSGDRDGDGSAGDGSAGNGSAGNGSVGDGSVGRGRVGGTTPGGSGSTGTGSTGTGTGTAGAST